MGYIETILVFLEMALLQIGIIPTLKENIEDALEINLPINLIAIILLAGGPLIFSPIIEVLEFDCEFGLVGILGGCGRKLCSSSKIP